jgi:hypothetical protein
MSAVSCPAVACRVVSRRTPAKAPPAQIAARSRAGASATGGNTHLRPAPVPFALGEAVELAAELIREGIDDLMKHSRSHFILK